MTLPFNTLDEMFLHLDDPARPLTVQMEVRVRGRLDDERVRQAVHTAAGRHPRARARLLPWRSDATSYEWSIDDELQIDPVRVIDSLSAQGLDEVRGDLYSRAIPLSESPPFRAQLVHDPGGDRMMLAVNHVAFDGIGALRLMQSIGRAYNGAPDPTPDIDPADAIPLAIEQGGGDGGDRLQNARLGLQHLARSRSRATQVAAKDPSPDPGYGVHTLSLPAEPLVSSALRHRLGATVNDLLLAAVHLSVEAWNRQQGKGAGRVALGIPVNARPEAWRYEVMTNLITSEVIWTTKGQRETPEACLTAVAAWTEEVKGRGSGPALVAQAKGWGGRVSQRRAFGGVVKAVAGYLSGTAAVSNLGQVPSGWIEPGDFEVDELWFSPPTVGTGLAIGTASVGDVLHVTLRHSRAVLSTDAAAAFAEVLHTELDVLSGAA